MPIGEVDIPTWISVIGMILTVVGTVGTVLFKLGGLSIKLDQISRQIDTLPLLRDRVHLIEQVQVDRGARLDLLEARFNAFLERRRS